MRIERHPGIAPDYGATQCDDQLPYVVRKFNDPDYKDCDDQIPVRSFVGMGPRGSSVIPKEIANTEDDVRIKFVNEKGQTLFTTENLSAGKVSFKNKGETFPGQETLIQATIKRGSKTETVDLRIPAGEAGSRIYLAPGNLAKREDDVYDIPTKDLLCYGQSGWTHRPTPRPRPEIEYKDCCDPEPPCHHHDCCEPLDEAEKPSREVPRVYDVVCAAIEDSGSLVIAFGDVVYVDEEVTKFIATTFVAPTTPYIDGATFHWMIGGVDTGVDARGVKGDKGDTGERGPIGPKGDDGKSVMIQSGIKTPSQLPPFSDTEVNYAYIVDDGDGQYDMYVRGAQYDPNGDRGWTVVENWQGVKGEPGAAIVDAQLDSRGHLILTIEDWS